MNMKRVPSDGVKGIRPTRIQTYLTSYLETEETTLTPKICEVWSTASTSRSSMIDDKPHKYRQFQSSWLKRDELKDWLVYDSSADIVKCSVCSTWRSNYDSKFVTGFSKPFKLETLKIHAKSQQHLNSLRNLELLKSEKAP
jgi:hypothetical protein